MTDPRTNLRDWLVTQVRDSGLSQMEIAERVGTSQKHISYMVTRRGGSLAMWERVLNVVDAETRREKG